MEEPHIEGPACRRGAFQVFIAPGRHVLFHETYRRESGVIEVDCWSHHGRRGFFKALASARELALTGIGFIGQAELGPDDPTRNVVAAAGEGPS